jgi:hypothetical protein
LISKKANPQTAFFEIDYNDGKKTLIEVDYSEVTLRQDIFTGVEFQATTPKRNGTNAYALSPLPPQDYAIAYNVSITINDISVADFGDNPARPLYLRPFYNPADIDPSLASTNMIKEIYLTDDTGRPIVSGDIFLGWDDEVQAITLKLKRDAIIPTSIVINAILQQPFIPTAPPPGGFIDRLACVVNIP